MERCMTPMKPEAINFPIVDGPSKFDWMVAFFEDPDRCRGVTIIFQVGGQDTKYHSSMSINALERVGTSESWFFNGEIEQISPKSDRWKKITGRYNTHYRNGEFQLIV
jgi:hypothetical protein